MPHAAVKCFCVCQSFPFHHEDFHHLLCTSWWVASSVSKSTQIENEQHPSQPQTWNRSAVGERTTLWGRAGRSLWWHISYLQIPSVFLNGSWAKELIDILENWVTSLTALQLCRLLRAACLHKASCGTYSTVMPWLSIQSCSRGCFSLEFITAAQRGPESSSANEERWERWKPWEHRAVGHRLQKLHGNFKGFLFLMLRSLYLLSIQHRAWVQF